MTRHIHVYLHVPGRVITRDKQGGWEEGKHPRADDGEFSSGSGGKPSGTSKAKPSATPGANGLDLNTALPEPDMHIQKALADKVTQHYPEAVKEYSTLPDAAGGKVLNTDVARELSDDYNADRTKSAAVHEPASWFIKALYADRLKSMKSGEKVVFTSGGTGAGKTSAVQHVPVLKMLSEDAAIVYDTNMNSMDSAVKKIEQALEAGGHVSIVHVQRDPVDALVNGALKRAASQAKKFGTGRTVPLSEHLKTHVGAADVLARVAEKYKDDPRVEVHVVDNTRGMGKAGLSDVSFVKGFDYNDMERKLSDALETEYHGGRIPENVYRATKGA